MVLSTRWLAMSFLSKIATLELVLVILSPTPTCIEQAHLSPPTVRRPSPCNVYVLQLFPMEQQAAAKIASCWGKYLLCHPRAEN